MNILMLIDRLDIGGAETHLVTLARAMTEKGVHVTVLSGGGELESELQKAGIPSLHFPAPVRGAVGLFRAWRFLHTLTCSRAFDVLHAHTRRTALLLRLLPKISLPRTAWASVPPPYRRRGWLRAASPLRVVTAHAHFSTRHRTLSYWGECTIAVSRDIRDHLLTAFLSRRGAHAVHVIPNGVELPPDAPPTRRSPRDFSVVFASRLDEDCSLVAEQLLRIAPALTQNCQKQGRRLQLTIIGGGSQYPTLCREASALAQACPDLPVTLTGKVSDPCLFYREADVFVGVSRAALEAAGQGCRVILAGNEGFGGCLQEDNFWQMAASNFCARGMASSRESDLLHSLCVLLDEDNATFAARAQAVCLLVRRHFCAARMAAATVRLYARALAQKRQLRLLCVGYFGRENLGDQAILRMLARRFEGACAPRSLADAPWYTAEAEAEADAAQVCRLIRAPSGYGIYRARRRLPLGKADFFPSFYTRYRCRDAAFPCGVRAHTARRDIPTSVPKRLHLCVLSGSVESGAGGRECHEGLDAIARRRPWVLLRHLCRADALLLGGGELLQNASRHGTLSLLYYLTIPTLGRWLGCPFSMRGGGVGVLRGTLARALTGAVMRRAVGISLREADSSQRLADCGVPPARLTRLCDGVVAWKARRRWLRASYPDRLADGYVCICPRAADAEALARLADCTAAIRPDLPRVYLAIGGEEDLALCRQLWAREGGSVLALSDERALYALLHRATVLISMRLHALILAGEQTEWVALPTAQTRDKLDAAERLFAE